MFKQDITNVCIRCCTVFTLTEWLCLESLDNSELEVSVGSANVFLHAIVLLIGGIEYDIIMANCILLMTWSSEPSV